jgi:spore coat-associated protein N
VTSRVLVLLATALAAVVSLSLGGEQRRGPILRATAGGALQLESSHDGSALLTASRLRPGDSAEGTLTLNNLAAGPQRLTLTTSDLRDTPGPGGGALSDWVDLRVERDGDPVFAGKLADMPDLDLGDLDAGSSTPFRFVVTLPEQGPAVDDAYAGGSVEVAWSWRGDTDAGPGPGTTDAGDEDPPPAAERPPAAPPAPSQQRQDVAPSGRNQAPPTPVDELEGPAATRNPRVRLWLGGRSKQRLGRSLRLSTVCRPGCTLRVAAKVRVGRRWRTLGRRALGRVASASQPSSVRFRLSALQQRSLRATLRRHGAVTVRIAVTASAQGHGAVTKVRSLRLRP